MARDHFREYRKRPIEAAQLTRENRDELAAAIPRATAGLYPQPVCLWIETLDGTMRAEVGDWIIRGVKGEYYPCKPDVFALTWEVTDGR